MRSERFRSNSRPSYCECFKKENWNELEKNGLDESTCGSWRQRIGICAMNRKRVNSDRICITGSAFSQSNFHHCGDGRRTFHYSPSTSLNYRRGEPANQNCC